MIAVFFLAAGLIVGAIVGFVLGVMLGSQRMEELQ